MTNFYFEKKLLKLIETNSKLTDAELAQMLQVDEALINQTIARLKDEGIIGGFHTMINWDLTDDEDVSAMIEVRVTPQKGNGYEKIAAQIYNFPEVESMMLVTGSFDYMILTHKLSMKQVADLVNRISLIEQVISTSTSVVLNVYKNHNVIYKQKKLEDGRMELS